MILLFPIALLLVRFMFPEEDRTLWLYVKWACYTLLIVLVLFITSGGL